MYFIQLFMNKEKREVYITAIEIKEKFINKKCARVPVCVHVVHVMR